MEVIGERDTDGRAGADEALPAPTGPYPIGRAMYHWRGRGDAAAAGDARELVCWIWYPAAPPAGAARAPYMPAGWGPAAQYLGCDVAAVRSQAVADAPLAPDRARYTVLLFSPAGFPPLLLAAILEEIASHGYIVVGLNHTRESAITVFPDGRVVPMDMALMRPVLGPFSGAHADAFAARATIADGKAADLRFATDQLERLDRGTDRFGGRLDLTRLGAFGHSLGGNAALEFARLDPRCRAAANLDGGNWNAVGTLGLDRPALMVMAEHAELSQPCEAQVSAGVYPSAAWCAAERAVMMDGWQAVYERARPGYGVLIEGSVHGSFMDLPFLPAAPGSPAAGSKAAAAIDAERAWRVTCDYLFAFFARHLDGGDGSLLDGPSPDHPEARLGSPADLFRGPGFGDTSNNVPAPDVR